MKTLFGVQQLPSSGKRAKVENSIFPANGTGHPTAVTFVAWQVWF
jgi:hypothetical protein